MDLHAARLSIVGLGLMGGSVARAMRGRVAELIGVDWDPRVVKLAQDLGVVDRATDDLVDGLQACDLAILATPVRAILDTLSRIGRQLPAPPRLLDLGSTKVEIIQAMEALPPQVDALGGHPLCGKEISGLAASEAELFRGTTFVLTPLERTSAAMLQMGHDLIAALGARPLILDAERHDRIVAITSHLPYLLAVTLVDVALEAGSADESLWELVASGFKDTSRLAASDVTMMSDVLLTNWTAIQKALDRARTSLRELTNLVSSGDRERLFAELTLIRTQRAALNPPPSEEDDGNSHHEAGK